VKECCNLRDKACEALQQAQQRIVWLLCEELQVKLAALYVSNQQRDEALRERDEARRDACHLHTKVHPNYDTPEEIAERRGWDCFKMHDSAFGGGA
jgi:hypothetical protein